MNTKICPFYQPHLSPNIPQVINNKDYQEYRSLLEQIDEILVRGKVEEEFVDLCLEHKECSQSRFTAGIAGNLPVLSRGQQIRHFS